MKREGAQSGYHSIGGGLSVNRQGPIRPPYRPNRSDFPMGAWLRILIYDTVASLDLRRIRRAKSNPRRIRALTLRTVALIDGNFASHRIDQ